MATVAQVVANRANAQKSTGPRTVEGKTASSMNALKHGFDAASTVIPGEDPAEYERVAAEYHSEIRPGTALEQFQVDTLVDTDWQRRRLKRIQGNLYRQLLAEGATPEEIDVNLLRDSPTGKLLRKVWGQIASLERAHSRALTELRRLRRERDQAEAAAVEEALTMPELPAMMAAAREKYLKRNEPNSAPESQPATPADNPALSL